MTSFSILSLSTGSVRPLGARGTPSGIEKTPVSGPIVLSELGLSGDEHGDIKHHGGAEKALHHYAFDHYSSWIQELGPHEPLLRPGAFGENLATTGMTEEDVSIGDVFSWGHAVVEVSQGRQPCWRLNERLGIPDMAKRVQASGRTGWYYRVLQGGTVAPYDEFVMVDRKAPAWTVKRIWRAFYVSTLDRGELSKMAELPQLAESWRRYARKRLDTGIVEDWTKRLSGMAKPEDAS